MAVVNLTLLCCGAFAQSTGGLQGVVKSESGQALANANVIAIPADSTARRVFGKTDSTGTFNLTGLAAGNYTICPQDLDSKHLDPCFWSSGTQVSVAAGQTVSNKVITVTSAATLQVRVDDPKKVTDPKAGSSQTLVAVILPNGRLAPMNLASSDDDGKTYQLAVPAGAHKIFIKNNDFKISNGKGEDVDKRADKDGRFPAPTVDAPVSATTGTSYLAVQITGKR